MKKNILKILINLIIVLSITTNVYAATLTVYPDTGSGGDSCDGWYSPWGTYSGVLQDDWDYAKTDTGVNGGDEAGEDLEIAIHIRGSSGIAEFATQLRRLYLSFDTSPLGSGASISAATLSMYKWQDNATNFGVTADKDPYLVAMTGQGTVPDGVDYTVGGSDFGGTSLGNGSASGTGWKNIALNASGLTHIKKTGVTGFGVLPKIDFNDTLPTQAQLTLDHEWLLDKYWAVDRAGTSQDPKLVITYTAAATDDAVFFGVNF